MAAPVFTRAPLVEAGQRITSTQAQLQARACNDRLRLVADLPWRISWYLFNVWRQVRNPDESGNVFPPQGEWFDIYQHIDPDYTMIEWPVAGPGMAEGANLANPMMQFVYGVGSVTDEPDRVQIPLRVGEAAPATPSEFWELGKLQRGCIDPATGAFSAPAFEAALSMYQVGWFHPLVPHHKSYGGWLPTPIVLEDHCGDTETDGLNIPSYEIFFTATRIDVATSGLHGTIGTGPGGVPKVTYAGSCPCGTLLHAQGHVMAISRGRLGYLVYVGRGDGQCGYDLDYLPAQDWIEGPYTGTPYLAHTDGGQLERATSAGSADFRGSDEQRSGDRWRIERVSFDFNAFFTSQYVLAPARAAQTGGSLTCEYPRATWGGAMLVPAGTAGLWSPGQTIYPVHPSCVGAGWRARATGLQTSVEIAVVENGEPVGTLSLQPDGAGAAETLLWRKSPAAGASIQLLLASDTTFYSSAGTIEVEMAELLAWKPQHWDAYVVTRTGGTSGGDVLTVGVDGRGRDFDAARELGRDLLRHGCIVNRRTGSVRPQATWVNDNPIYDAARRLTSSILKIIPRRQFVAYEVAGGKSILYLKRFAYGLANSRVDMFAGVAPPIDEVTSGTLVEGEVYIVQAPGGGSVTYRGASIGHGGTFVAGLETVFQAHDTAKLYVHDGIKHAAIKARATNEWLMVMETKPYHPSVSSIWKSEAYADYFTWVNRCLLYPQTMPAGVRRHVAFNHQVSVSTDPYGLSILPMSVQASVISPEAPPGFNFSAGTNSASLTDDFCRSCQIYPSPYEIESCTVDDWAQDQVIKIVFKGRFRAVSGAPATVPRDPGTWSAADITALNAEAYRTDDNALRQYAKRQQDGGYEAPWKTGDAAAGSGLPSTPDNPFGSVFPTFHFVRLVPEPYDDGNDILQAHDTRCLIDGLVQQEISLRSTCEAWVDDRTSAAITCATAQGGLYDYTFENLCFDAFAGRSIGAFDLSSRPDAPPGFGPMPNTPMFAEVFNRISKALNLLTRLRVDLPMEVEARLHTGTVDRAVTPTPAQSCTTTGALAVWLDGALPTAVPDTSMSPGSWDPSSGFSASKTGFLTGCDFVLRTSRRDWEWRFEPAPSHQYAMPDWLQEMFNEGRHGLLAKLVTTVHTEGRQATTLALSDECCRAEVAPCPGHWGDGTDYFRWLASEAIQTECAVIRVGIVQSPEAPASDFNLGRDADMNAGVFCSNDSFGQVDVTLYDTTPFVEFQLTD